VLLVIAATNRSSRRRASISTSAPAAHPNGVIVLTKSDLVEPDILDLVRLEAREFVSARSWSRRPWSPSAAGPARGSRS